MLEAEGYAQGRRRPRTPRSSSSTRAASARTPTQRLYGNLGHVKAIKDRRPDMKIVVGGCLAQKDRSSIQERAPYVDVVLGTHNLASLPRLLEESDEGPAFEILEQTEVVPVGACRRAGTRRGTRGCRSRSAATTRARSASSRRSAARRSPDRSATSSQEVAGPRRRRRRRGDAARPERELLRPRPRRHAAVLEAACTRSTRSRGLERVRFTSPHPKDFRADTRRGDGRLPDRCASTSTCRCRPARTACSSG